MIQEYAQTGLDTYTGIFVVIALIRVISVGMVHDAALGDPDFKFNNFSYWLIIMASIGSYLAAFHSFFYDVPRIIVGPETLIESSRVIHDNVGQIWALTSLLPGLPALVVLFSLFRSRSKNTNFALRKLIPILIFDWGLCLILNIASI